MIIAVSFYFSINYAHAYVYDDFSANTLDLTKWNLSCIGGCPNSGINFTSHMFQLSGNTDGSYLFLIGYNFRIDDKLDFDFIYARDIIGFQYESYPTSYGSFFPENNRLPVAGKYHMHLEFLTNKSVIFNVTGVNNFYQSGSFSYGTDIPIFYPSVGRGEMYLDNFTINGKNDGIQCDRDYECKNNYCVHSFCRSTPIFCGDNYCDTTETCTNCFADCGCNTGYICTEQNTCLKKESVSCVNSSECLGGFCVNNICRNQSTFCGDTYCDSGETCNNCIADCGCKNDFTCTSQNVCLKAEGAFCNKISDCAIGSCVHNVCRNTTTFCGDNFCDSGETCSTCQADCGCNSGNICSDGACKANIGSFCSPTQNCLQGYCVHGICRQQMTYCGDNFCDGDENAFGCFDDCKHQTYLPISLFVLTIAGFIRYKLWKKHQAKLESQRTIEERKRREEQRKREEELEKQRKEEERKRKKELEDFEKELVQKLELTPEDKNVLVEIKKFTEYLIDSDESSRELIGINKIPELERLRDNERIQIDDKRRQHELEKMKKHLEKVNHELEIIGPKIKNTYIKDFVMKSGIGDLESIKKLKNLLKTKGINIEYDTLKKLVSEKFKEKQEIEQKKKRKEELNTFEKDLVDRLNVKKDDVVVLNEIKKFTESLNDVDINTRKLLVSNKLPQLKRLRDSERGKIETEKLVEHLKKIDDELKTIGPKIRDNYIHIFVKRYGGGSEKSINNLKDLLKTKGINIEYDTIKKLVSEKFKEKQLAKGLVEYKNKWVTKKEFIKLQEIDIGLDKNFMNMNGYQFEEFIAELFTKIGYKTRVTSKSRDFGIDVIAKGNGDIIAIQCKRFADGVNVGNRDVQRAKGSIDYHRANKCIIITNQDFTVQAKIQARGTKNIELWGRTTLHKMVKKYFIKDLLEKE